MQVATTAAVAVVAADAGEPWPLLLQLPKKLQPDTQNCVAHSLTYSHTHTHTHSQRRTPQDVPEIMSLEKQVNNTGRADENENPTKNGRHKKRGTVQVEIESKVGSGFVLRPF